MKKAIVAVLLAAVMVLSCACAGSSNNANVEPKVPDLEAHGITGNLKLGEKASYKTATKLDVTVMTTGELTITERNVYQFADALPDEALKPLEGYEWVEVKATSMFTDDNARDCGVDRASCVTNYYDVTYYEQHIAPQEDGFVKFSVKPDEKGESFDECLYTKVVDNLGWNDDRQTICNYTWYFRVPVGYDGMVIVFFNSAIEWPDGKYVYEVLDADSLVYRVMGEGAAPAPTPDDQTPSDQPTDNTTNNAENTAG